jgi:N-acetylated-alpha-linked acidic dipeptidase
MCRVEAIANSTDFGADINFAPLNASIDAALNASRHLDVRREAALKKLRHLLPKPKKPKHVHKHGGRGAWWSHFARALFGGSCGMHDASDAAVAGGLQVFEDVEVPVDKEGWPEIPEISKIAGVPDLPREGANEPQREPSAPPHRPDTPHRQHPHPHPPQPPHIPKKDRKAIAHVLRELRRINQVVRSFEYGFISDEGIKGREWYRHKGVAPGKWLGYGATTVSGSGANRFDRVAGREYLLILAVPGADGG